MKRLMLLISAILTLSGCSNSNEQASINLSIEEYEAKIEEALLMTNGYQDAKYTSAREELDEFLISSRDKYEFELTSPYEGLTLDEALDYYNNLNGTELVNITKKEMADNQDVLDSIEQSRENAENGVQEANWRQPLIDSKEEGFYEEDTSIGRYVWLKGIADTLVDCGEVCSSNLISYADAKKWVETGEYNVEWTYIDGELVNPPMIENDSNSSDDISTYKALELTIDDATTSYGYITVEGSISNPTNNAYSYVELKVKILDKNGKVIDTENTYAVGSETLSPGDTKKWDAMLKADDRADNVEVEIVDYKIKY